MLSRQLCPLVTWGRREPVALDFAEHGKEAGTVLSDNRGQAQNWLQPGIQLIFIEH